MSPIKSVPASLCAALVIALCCLFICLFYFKNGFVCVYFLVKVNSAIRRLRLISASLILSTVCFNFRNKLLSKESVSEWFVRQRKWQLGLGIWLAGSLDWHISYSYLMDIHCYLFQQQTCYYLPECHSLWVSACSIKSDKETCSRFLLSNVII